MERTWWVLIAGLLLAGSACGHRPGAAADGDATRPAYSAVRVIVTNHYEIPMEIFATGSGMNHRLGLVDPGITRSFVVPRALVGYGRMEFLAQPSGVGPTVRSGDLTLSPGDIVDFEITTHLFDSRATVRR